MGDIDYQAMEFAYEKRAEQDAGAPPAPRGGGGRRPGRPDHRAGPGPPRPARGGAGRRLPAVDRLARHLLLQAHAGNLGPPGRGPAHDRQGRVLERRQGLLPRAGSLALRPAARARPPPTRLHQPAAVLRRGLPVRAGPRRAEHRPALEKQGRRPGTGRRRRGCQHRDARRPLHAARRLADRLRRRALAGAQADRPGKPRPHLPRPLPDRRREDEGRFPGRALVLVRPALPPQSVRAAAHAAGQRLAHRLPAGLERRSRRGGQARERAAAHPRPARARHPVRPGMGQRLHLRLRAHGRVPPWSRGLRRRLGAPRLALRRARCQQRRAGRREPGLETRW